MTEDSGKVIYAPKSKIEKDKMTIYGAGLFHEESLVINKDRAALLMMELWEFLGLDENTDPVPGIEKKTQIKEEFVIIDVCAKKGSHGDFQFYDVQSNSFFMGLPFATFFRSITRAEFMLKRVQKLHPDKTLIIKNVKEFSNLNYD